MINSIKK